MGKELRFGPAQPGKPIPRALGPMDEPLEFAARPTNDIEIDPFETGTQLRLVKVAVVADPAPNDRTVQIREVLQGLAAAVMKRPAPDFPADTLQCLRAGCGQEAMGRLPLPHRFPRPELETQEVKCDHRKAAAPVHILAVDDLRLLRMQPRLASRKAVRKRTP